MYVAIMMYVMCAAMCVAHVVTHVRCIVYVLYLMYDARKYNIHIGELTTDYWRGRRSKEAQSPESSVVPDQL